jgi:tRNA pseudouridine55 synthase
MDGLLVVDKPAGPTSHDVVARVRRVLRERRVGHTGTLDPIATGVLPLVVGRATRLARFLSASDKAYEAVVALGCATDTGDAAGRPLGTPQHERLPSRAAIERALDAFRGTFLQQPPAFSAKKIGGTRSYRVARQTRATHAGSDPGSDPQAGDRVRPSPIAVTLRSLDLVDVDGNRVTLRLECSSGFYVRSLAHDLGERLGVGAHLAALRRTRSGDYTLADALPLDAAELDATAAAARLIPLARMLPGLPALSLSPEGVRRARHGQDLRPQDAENGLKPPFGEKGPHPLFVRLVDPAGDLMGIARPADAPGLLHPFVILG